MKIEPYKFAFIFVFYLFILFLKLSLILRGLRVSGFAHHSLDGFDAISQCEHHLVGVCDGGIGDVFVLKLDHVG
jgi:hypothetical protein